MDQHCLLPTNKRRAESITQANKEKGFLTVTKVCTKNHSAQKTKLFEHDINMR